MIAHAELGASSSARWMNCPGSVPLARPYLSVGTSPYAAEGTVAHTIAQAMLTEETPPPIGALVDVDGISVLVTQEMFDAVDVYLDIVRPLLAKASDGGVEIKVHINSVPPTAECYGTADFVALIDRKLFVVDLKYGKGVRVPVASNSQALFYALAVVETLDLGDRVDEVEITICQPRIDGAERQTWTIDIIDLWMWRDSKLIPAVQRILDGDRSLTDGPWCRFCPALAICPLKHELAMAAAEQAFEDGTSADDGISPNTEDVTEAELAERLQLALRLTDWIDALKDEAALRIHRGYDVPGFKLVEGRSNRKWADEDSEILRELVQRGSFTAQEAEKFYAPPELQSPAQLEKTLKRMKRNAADLFVGLINKPPGKPALVTDDDPRPAMTVLSARDAFRLSAELEDEV
jgi:hypothetical protein